ncbi:pyridoxamine 5'-phosphate oxidase family protein [Microbacterium paludicola]|uniref:pyridoxamine 5'-phosphate oxidase family protein n=1 Tax=Microbacterium paludicola TaxID=300019 RepID=UPI0031D6F862
MSSAQEDREVEELPTGECWRLLEIADIGRLAVTRGDGGPDVYPVNFIAHQGRIYLRSGAGPKLRSMIANPAVAIEVDGEEDGFHWSVVVRGVAARTEVDSEILASGAARLVSHEPARKPHVLRITPDSVTGRRFAKRSTPGEPTPPRRGAPPADAPGKPKPIPHFPPPWQR